MEKDVTVLLQSLADKVGVTVEHLWPFLVKQEAIFGWTNLFVWISLLCGLSIYVIYAMKSHEWVKHKYGDEYEPTPIGICNFLVSLITGGAYIVFFVFLHLLVNSILNPEAAALTRLLDLLS